MEYIISVVVPMYFEEEVAMACYTRITQVMKEIEYDYEIIFVNDGSRDNTKEILKEIANRDKKAKIINFSRNFGHQMAVTAGIDKASGNAIIIIDADLQDPPELIKDMISLWRKGADVVYAVRKARKGETLFKVITAKYFYKFLNFMTNINIPKDTGDFRLIDRKVAEVFKSMPESNRFIRGMISWVGFEQVPIEYVRNERYAGKTKYPLKKMLKFATDAIISFSIKPLKLIELLGGISIIISIILLIYAIIDRILNNTSGWASIIVAISFFSGVQLISLGMIGEYIARIYEENKKRPLYIISEEINFDDFGSTKSNKH